MNSLVKVFSNFREFYNEINGATLTGAIDVIVVEQPDGEFQCSPFHVRFGKLGVLRSREKIVDIMINGEPVDIHMKLGDSGEAFFVEECSDDLEEELPDNLATSPIPASFLSNKFENASLDDENSDTKTKTASEEITLPLPLPRRNSIDFSKEAAKEETEPIFENQVSDFSHRRHTDNLLERRNLSDKLKEYTTQKLRQEWAEHEEVFQIDVDNTTKLDGNNVSLTVEEKLKTSINEKTVVPHILAPMLDEPQQQQQQEQEQQIENAKEAVDLNVSTNTTTPTTITTTNIEINNITNKAIEINKINNNNGNKEESKNKKKRRKKTQMKKKNAQRKSSSSSSIGSNITVADGTPQADEIDTLSVISISNQNNNSSNEDECKSMEPTSVALLTANGGEDSHSLSEHCQSSPMTPSARLQDLDIHFFSDTEITSSGGNGPIAARGMGRPSTPIQSDSEFEISKRDKDIDVEESTSWKWGELPTADIDVSDRNTQDVQAQAQRRSMLSGMFNFMKRTNQIRKQGTDGGVYLSDLDAEGMDPEITAMYFPISKENTPTLAAQSGVLDDDGESGNGTSLPHSPSSMEGAKSLDSDYEDGKPTDSKYLDFVAMSMCGGLEKGDPTDDEFDKKIINYSDVCKDSSLFASPNLVVRLNGKFYTWAAACPIVMTMITFQKPLSDDVIEQLMLNTKINGVEKQEQQDANVGQTRRSWWNWRRAQSETPIQTNLIVHNNEDDKISNKSNPITITGERDGGDLAAAATQTSRPITPDVSEATLSKTESNINAENTSVMVENLEELSQISNNSPEKSKKGERYKKSLRLSSDVIKILNLREGMNEIEFSVTTAYQGTSRCKCCLFRWKHNDKVVISDIDGTITKSDVLGHILPMVGKDWAQLGVAELFSKIEENGYKLLYLSARAIGQSRATREYLRSIRQGDVCLPDGPLLLNPTSLISAFHREVIEKKPEQFKIACLTDIRDLFPDKNPFYAGYGNRINDVWAYRAVGIPIMRIFTINTKGELKHELTQTFQSSYCGMAYIVDQLFPPIDEGSIEYSNFNYWRDPIPDLNLELNGSTESKQMPTNTTITTTATPTTNTINNIIMTSSTTTTTNTTPASVTSTNVNVNIKPTNTSAMLSTIPEN